MRYNKSIMQEYFICTVDKIVRVFEYATLKIIFSIFLGVGSFLFGDLYIQGMIALVMLMSFDTILGVAAAIHERPAGTKILSPQCLNSRRFSRLVVKGLVYFSAISAAYFADQTIPLDFIQAAMISFVGITEFISILENISRLGYRTPKHLLDQLKEYEKNGKLR